MAKRTYVKTTKDGRRLEVVGLAICLDDKLECFELIMSRCTPTGVRFGLRRRRQISWRGG
jgi:hypothetical protein